MENERSDKIAKEKNLKRTLNLQKERKISNLKVVIENH